MLHRRCLAPSSDAGGSDASAPERVVLISDFNIGPLEKSIVLHSKGRLKAEAAAFGEVMSVLLNEANGLWHPTPSGVFVWTRPHHVLPSVHDGFNRCGRVDPDQLRKDVASFAEAVRSAAKRCGCVMVANWLAPLDDRGWGVLEAKSWLGFEDIVRRANVMLSDALEGIPGVVLLETSRWFDGLSRQAAFDPKLWFAAKIPFVLPVYQEAAKDVVRVFSILRSGARKVLVLDCDNTLWGGIVGEEGWQNLRLGGIDPVGEAFKAFQQRIKRLIQQGVILALASKNEESVVWEAFEKHPEMVLKKEDFAAWRINWDDKAANLVSLAEELNVGLDALVFVDDHPVERARVAEALPDVLVVELPEDPMKYRSALDALDCFDQIQVSEEDRKRSLSYLQEKQRRRALEEGTDIGTWLKSLDLKITIEPLTGANMARVEQLFNKTNQMNLTTRRMSAAQLVAWLDHREEGVPFGHEEDINRGLWAFRVKDRFGDAGLVGLMTLELDLEDDTVVVTDFILSCRVFGRMIEHAMLATAVDVCREQNNVTRLKAVYRPTPKNSPCLNFLRASGMSEEKEHVFVWPVEKPYPMPEHIDCRYSGEPAVVGALYPDFLYVDPPEAVESILFPKKSGNDFGTIIR